MQISFSIQIGVVLALLCANSQALPILDHSDPKISKHPVNHVERNSNGDDVISLYGIYRRQLDPKLHPRDTPDQFSHHIPNPQSEKSHSNDPNTPPLPLQAADTTTTLTSTTTIISTPLSPSTETPISQGHAEIRTPKFSPRFPLPITIPPPHSASSHGTSSLPASLPSIHYLYATERNQHQPHVSEGQPTKHDGHRGDSIFRPVPIFGSNHRVNGWESSGPLESLFAHPSRFLKDILDFINPLSEGFRIRLHKVRPGPPFPHAYVHPVQPQPFGRLFRFMRGPFRLPGARPASKIYQPSPLHFNNPTPPTTKLIGPGGTIHMASPSLTNSKPLPIHFTLSPQTCSPLAMECECMAQDIATRLTKSYPLGIPASTNSVTETVAMLMNGVEYRATLDLKLDNKIDGQGFRDLVGLFLSVKKELAHATHGRGFGTVRMHGDWHGVGVEAHWTYYVYEHGVARRCN